MDKIKEYAVTNYPKTFKDVSDVIVEENDVCLFCIISQRWFTYSN